MVFFIVENIHFLTFFGCDFFPNLVLLSSSWSIRFYISIRDSGPQCNQKWFQIPCCSCVSHLLNLICSASVMFRIKSINLWKCTRLSPSSNRISCKYCQPHNLREPNTALIYRCHRHWSALLIVAHSVEMLTATAIKSTCPSVNLYWPRWRCQNLRTARNNTGFPKGVLIMPF